MGCVNRPEDTFAQFLASLTRQMDDHHVRGGDLAAELFVSRSLLDRLVTAAAGESPARFRRRLLLERAAFQLRSTGVTVIDAATQAGTPPTRHSPVRFSAPMARRHHAGDHRAAPSTSRRPAACTSTRRAAFACRHELE